MQCTSLSDRRSLPLRHVGATFHKGFFCTRVCASTIVCAIGYAAFACPMGLAQSTPAGDLPVLPGSVIEAQPNAPIDQNIVEEGLLEERSLDSSPVDNAVDRRTIDSQYLLGTGDQVLVTVFNAPDYSGEFSVLAGGALNLPLAGEISVEGLTIPQASEEISRQLSRYIRRPRTTVSLLAARPLQVAIAGQVNRPGAYTLPAVGEDGSATPTLTEVISLAGGITQSADIRNISVLRQSSQQQSSQQQSSQQQREESIEVNLWQLLQEGQLSADLPLQRGDRIIIPEATALSAQETTELASASFSPSAITVNVVGEVETPGAIELPPNAPLNQAILAAGGFNRRARQNSVSLIRLNSNGTVAQTDVNIDFESSVNAETNPPLRPNDTIVVGTNGLNRVADTLGTVLSPINNGFGLLRLFGL